MSTWTAATQAIRDKVEATLGAGGTAGLSHAYTEIPDGADIDGHADLFMRKGYAVNIQEADTVESSVKTRNRVEERTYSIQLTREVNVVRTNTEAFVSLKSEMIEHSELVRNAFETDNTLSAGGSSTVIDIDWQGDSGVDEIIDPDPERAGRRYYIIGTEYAVKIQFR